MTAAAVGIVFPALPVRRSPGDDDQRREPVAGRAVASQRVLHQLVRRELRLLADLATWAPADETERSTALTHHAELIGKVLLHHHAVEQDAVWPALLQAVPAARADEVRAAILAWTARCTGVDRMLRDVGTAARQWPVASTDRARDAFAMACRAVSAAVDAQTADEEDVLLPLLDRWLRPQDWVAIARSARCALTPREQLLVLGLALEDSCTDDRARLLEGVPRGTRRAWRLYGARRYRAAVVRLRGAPPAS